MPTKKVIEKPKNAQLKISDNKQLAAEARKIVSKSKIHNKPKRNVTRKAGKPLTRQLINHLEPDKMALSGVPANCTNFAGAL